MALADYGFPWDGLVGRFKFEQQPELAQSLAPPLVQAVRAHLACPGWPRPTLVVPIPLSRQRLAERGYNQAWELARRVARQLGLPAAADVLLRWRNSPHQVGADRQQRQANLAGAMGVDPTAKARVRGHEVALVDDVLTTGVTMRVASAALRDAGASGVQVWVLARTPAPTTFDTGLDVG